MAHELCVKTAPAVSGPFFWRFCTPLSEAHMVVGSWTLALWGPRECSDSPRLPPTALAPSLPYLGGMGSPRGMLAPTLWCTTTARKRLNGRFWGHCVGVAGGAPRRVQAVASSGGGPSRVISHPGQHRFWWNGGNLFVLEARDQRCSVQKRLKRVPAGRLGRARSRAFVGRLGTRAACHASQTC